MRRVPIRYINDGATLANNIYTNTGEILLRRGASLTQNKLDRLIKLGYNSLYINDEFSNNEIDDLIDPVLRMKSKKNLKDAFEDFNTYVNQMKNSSTVSKKAVTKLRYGYLSNITNSATSIVEKLLLNKEIEINIQDIKNMEEYLYQHSVNVAVLSVLFGIAMGFSYEKLNALAIGSLMHDIGYNFIDSDVLMKKEKLSDEEYKQVKTHTELGYHHLKDNIDISAHIRMIVYQHHEYMDGSGYPKGLKGEDISELAKMVAIADIYDALTSDRPYRDALSPLEANEVLLAHAINQLDPGLVRKFTKLVVPYPIGTLVKLSNDEIGVVEDIDADFPMRPVIRVVLFRDRKVEIITRDLMKENNILITGIQYEIPRYS